MLAAVPAGAVRSARRPEAHTARPAATRPEPQLLPYGELLLTSERSRADEAAERAEAERVRRFLEAAAAAEAARVAAEQAAAARAEAERAAAVSSMGGGWKFIEKK